MYKVDNKKLKKELEDYISDCEFKEVTTKSGKTKRKIYKRGFISEELGEMIQKIATGLATKGNWKNYTWREDFISMAILTSLKYMHNFNPEKSDNAHGYINMICSHCFMQFIQKEKKHSLLKQELYDKRLNVNGDNETVNYENL